MRRIIICLLILIVSIPAIVFAEVTRKVVDKYPSLSSGGTELPGNPKTIVYLDSKGKEVAREMCDETGKVIKTIGKIPDGIVKEYFESGSLLAEYNYKGGKLEGKSKGFYENGAFRGEWNYQNGKLEGINKVYYGNGKLNYELNYKNDKRDGISKYYDENENLIYEWSYKEDKLEGISKGYYESGKLNKEYNYKDGKREGTSKEYYQSGKLRSIETYKNGQKINKKEYDDKGNLISGKDYSVEEKKGQ